jgi:hypothetical protein
VKRSLKLITPLTKIGRVRVGLIPMLRVSSVYCTGESGRVVINVVADTGLSCERTSKRFDIKKKFLLF